MPLAYSSGSPVIIAPTRGSNLIWLDCKGLSFRSSSPLRGAATNTRAPPAGGRSGVIIAPTRGSNRSRTSQPSVRAGVIIAPTRGSNWGIDHASSGRSRLIIAPAGASNARATSHSLRASGPVIIAPTRGSNRQSSRSSKPCAESSSPLRGAATRTLGGVPRAEAASSSPLRGAATCPRCCPAGAARAAVIIAPTRGSNTQTGAANAYGAPSSSPLRGAATQPSVRSRGSWPRSSSPLRGAATGMPGRRAPRCRAVIIAPTRGSNASAASPGPAQGLCHHRPYEGQQQVGQGPAAVGVRDGHHRPYEGQQHDNLHATLDQLGTGHHRPYEGQQRARLVALGGAPVQVIIAPTRGSNCGVYAVSDREGSWSSSPLRGAATLALHRQQRGRAGSSSPLRGAAT